jgi:hypothetical protein
MKKNLLLLAAIFTFLCLQSCEFITLSSQERALSGYWKQNVLVAEVNINFKSDKTFEMFVSSGLVSGVLVRWTGTWKTMEKRLVTELGPGPEIRATDADADMKKVLNNLDLSKLQLALSSKISAVDADNLILESDGKETVMKRGDAEKFNELKKRFDKMSKK